MAGRSDDETTLGPNFFGRAQNKHERAVSTAETFPQNIPDPTNTGHSLE